RVITAKASLWWWVTVSERKRKSSFHSAGDIGRKKTRRGWNTRSSSVNATAAQTNMSRAPRAFFHLALATTPAKPRPRPKASRPPKINTRPALKEGAKGSSVTEKSTAPMSTDAKLDQKMVLSFSFRFCLHINYTRLDGRPTTAPSHLN